MYFWFRRVIWFIEKILLKEVFFVVYLEFIKIERKFVIGRDLKFVEYNLIFCELI